MAEPRATGGPEAPRQPEEQRSSVKITRNAKGEAQYEIKAYEGVTAEELTRLRGLAVSEYRALNDELKDVAA